MRKLLLAAASALISVTALVEDVTGKLVLYTSQPNKGAQQTVDTFTAKHSGVEVEWFRDGTTKVMAKLRATNLPSQ